MAEWESTLLDVSLICGRPLMAVSRSSVSSIGRLLWRKLTIKPGQAAAIYYPLQSLKIRDILAL